MDSGKYIRKNRGTLYHDSSEHERETTFRSILGVRCRELYMAKAGKVKQV